MSNQLLEMRKISKEFPGVKALDQVDFSLSEGDIVALLGENGAGKSTLMKILTGVYRKTQGEVYYRQQPVDFTSPRQAQEQGIAMIHQELNLIPDLTVGENIFLGREPKAFGGRIDWNQLYAQADELLARLGFRGDSRARCGSLSIGQQQLVEIAKALSLDARILVMDEPTDALTDQETEQLFRVIRELKQEKRSIIYISHRLHEIFQLCDEVTVLRDGKLVGTRPVAGLTEDELIEMMVGRKLTEQFPPAQGRPGAPLLVVENLTNAYVKQISFQLHQKEILGVAGLMGAQRTELAKTLVGALKKEQGALILEGIPVQINSPEQAKEAGLVYVSEDRKKDGLILGLSVKENMTLPSLKRFTKKMGRLNHGAELDAVEDYVRKLSIKTPGVQQQVKNLSGGNQQKISIAKSLMTRPKVLILDEPTRGVDVGAKKEIYQLIQQFRAEGMSILLISSEIPELLGMCDRILVLHEGRLTGELKREEATQEKIIRFAMGMEVLK